MSVVRASLGHKSVKHEIISDTNTKMLVSVGIATFIVIFCAFSVRALISQSLYNGRLIEQKEIAKEQLVDNKKALIKLSANFASLDAPQTNILDGVSSGSGGLDGKNSKIILDALPNRYDYPGLSSSFEKILKEGGYDISAIGGREDPALSLQNTPSGVVASVEIPYSFSVTSSVDGTKKLLTTLESWIRPMHLTSLQLTFGEGSVQTRVTLKTYFTPPKTFELGKKEVK